MYKKEVNKRSPLRVFERSIHGGLGKGHVGVVASRAGVGKTAVMVGVALDDLMRDRNVLHVCLDEPVEKVRNFYDEVFHDLAESTKLEGRSEAHVAIERHRVIHTYANGSFSMEKLKGALEMMREHMHFVPEAIMIDGYPDFASASEADLAELKQLAVDHDAELWLTALRHRDEELDGNGVPAQLSRFGDALSVVVLLEPSGDHVQLKLVKDHDSKDVADLQMELDPGTLLLKW